jgi:hypothetical protein
MGEMRNAKKEIVRKSEWKRPHGISRHKWEDNVITNLKEIG